MASSKCQFCRKARVIFIFLAVITAWVVLAFHKQGVI